MSISSLIHREKCGDIHQALHLWRTQKNTKKTQNHYLWTTHCYLEMMAVSAELPMLSPPKSNVCVVLSSFHKSTNELFNTLNSMPLQSKEFACCGSGIELDDTVLSRISPQYFSDRPSRSQSGVCPMYFEEGEVLQKWSNCCCFLSWILRQNTWKTQRFQQLSRNVQGRTHPVENLPAYAPEVVIERPVDERVPKAVA